MQLISPSLIVATVLFLAVPSRAEDTGNWPQFRGPNCSGVAAAAKPPVEIGPSNAPLWTIEVPWSPSSPCVWGTKIFLTTFTEQKLQTRCYDTMTGRLWWTREVKPDKLEVFHGTDGSPAASTPATDGRRVVSYFGSYGLICYDIKGKEQWRHPLPVALSGGGFGTGTSPVIAGGWVLLNRDQDENSSLLAIDLATGKTVWETPRTDLAGSFGTPVVWKNGEVEEVAMPGSGKLKGYDLRTGKERWVVENVVGFACTTPVVGEGLLFFAGWSPGKADAPFPSWEKFAEQHDKNHDGEVSFDELDAGSRDFLRGLDKDHDGKLTKADWEIINTRSAKAENVMVAVKPGGEGNITDTHVAWKATRGLPYVPSPLFYAGRVYLIKDGGMISSFDAKTGKEFYLQERLEAGDKYYASPVAADGRIYVASLAGKVTVLRAGGDKPEALHRADFGERIFATPALVNSNLYLRTQTKLYAFGNGGAPGKEKRTALAK